MVQVTGELVPSVTVQVVDVCDTCAPDAITLLAPQWTSFCAASASEDAQFHVQYQQVLLRLFQRQHCTGTSQCGACSDLRLEMDLSWHAKNG